MKWILVVLAVCLSVGVSDANQIAAQAGAERVWLDRGDGQWTELFTPFTGAGYDVVIKDDGTAGMSFSLRAAQDEDLLTEYAVEGWGVGSAMEYFGGGQFDVWNSGFTGQTEFLFGFRGGIRFTVIGEQGQFEMSARYARGDWFGSGGVKQAGIFFGLRLSETLGQ